MNISPNPSWGLYHQLLYFGVLFILRFCDHWLFFWRLKFKVYITWICKFRNIQLVHVCVHTHVHVLVYKYYIPGRLTVRMFTLRKWLSPEVKPRSIIIFEGWTFLLLPSQECTIYFIIPKLLSGKKRYGNDADEKDAAFFKTTHILFYNVWLNLIKKTSTHTW